MPVLLIGCSSVVLHLEEAVTSGRQTSSCCLADCVVARVSASSQIIMQTSVVLRLLKWEEDYSRFPWHTAAFPLCRKGLFEQTSTHLG